MRALALAALIAAVAPAAHAQGFVPAQSSSTPYYFFGGWVLPPPGSDWQFQRKRGLPGTDEFSFARGQGYQHTWAATVTTMDADPPANRDELSTFARLRAESGQGRKVTLRSFEATPDSTLGPMAVRYRYRIEDRKVSYDKGKLYVLEAQGLMFAHPGAARRLVILEASQRAKDPIPLEPDAVADSFFAHARLLAIDTASVAWRFPVNSTPEQIRTGPGGIWTTARVHPEEGKKPTIATEILRLDSTSRAVQSRTRVEGGIADIILAYESLWACDFENGRLLRLDPTTLATTGTMSLGGHPLRLLASGGAVWVTNPSEGRVHIVDPSTMKPIGKPIRALERPYVMLEAEGMVWIANGSPPMVRSFDPRTREPVGSEIALGAQLGSMAYGSNSIWITSGQKLQRLDIATRTPTAEIALGYNPGGIVFAGDAVWVAHIDAGTLTRIDPATNAVAEESRCVGLDVTRPAASPDGIWFSDAIAGAFCFMRFP